MKERFRISVRELVAFSFFEEDILPAGDMSVLLAGTLAHKARQNRIEGETEVSIKHAFSTADGEVLVYGRMDVLIDGEIPLIEEIKLGTDGLSAPLPQHRAQAVCYAAMLALEKPCACAAIRVCYVDEAGGALRGFEETLSADELKAEMERLLAPYLSYAVREETHRRARDESLKALPFPFEGYRKGQRELAVQVYAAISRRKRLFASLPTGTGKSAAVLYPALKAMSEGKTQKIVYLTARNTARQSPMNALERMRSDGMRARCSVLTAKEKLCPAPARCHPDACPRAKGHFLRQPEAIEELLKADEPVWTDDVIRQVADRHRICPFELALGLSELADVLLMDLNYAFDPFAQVIRLFQRGRNLTLLVDEAHHTVDRVRESLSGTLDGRELVQIRAAYGKSEGRRNAYYRALTALIHALRELEAGSQRLERLPDGIEEKVRSLLSEAAVQAARGGMASEAARVMRICLPFLYALEHFDEDYAILLEEHGRERALTLYCLLPGKEIARVTKGLHGTVFFSATLSPLAAMKRLLGGGEEDACFSLPSPFDPSHLAVVIKAVNTRFSYREKSADQIAECITELVRTRPGSYIAYFPSYAYLRLVQERLAEEMLPSIWVQSRGMEDAQREAFMEAFSQDGGERLGLCVLGGLFSEGIDLPGNRLTGVIVIGVGLPTPSARIDAVKECYQRHFGDGFAYACRIPAMQKVQQAAGRVIRSEADKGIVLLLDDRYTQPEYEALLPEAWRLYNDIPSAVKQLEDEKI